MSFFKIKPIWKGNSKHKKLSEELALQNAKLEIEQASDALETENDLVTFKLKYLGSTVVEKVSVSDKNTISSEAVKNIIKTAKASRKQHKKLQRVNVVISVKGIAVTDLQGNDIFKASIYRISNCSTDSTHRQVFSFISTDENETMECHAFFCSKRKIAETVTLAVAKIFTTAYEVWQGLPNSPDFQKNQKNAIVSGKNKDNTKENEINKTNALKLMNENNGNMSERVVSEEKLIDFDSEGVEEDDFEFDRLCWGRNVSNNSQWVCFEDDFVNESVRMPSQKSDLILA